MIFGEEYEQFMRYVDNIIRIKFCSKTIISSKRVAALMAAEVVPPVATAAEEEKNTANENDIESQNTAVSNE